MTVHGSTVRDLPDALHDEGLFFERLAGRRPAVFLDYDGVLTPIVDRPEDAVISKGMRTTVRALARRCPVCVVSGRDRQVVQELMGVDDLVVAGSHGFDIWSPSEGTIAHDAGSGYEDLISDATDELRAALGLIPGVVIESKRASVAVHYRHTARHDAGIPARGLDLWLSMQNSAAVALEQSAPAVRPGDPFTVARYSGPSAQRAVAVARWVTGRAPRRLTRWGVARVHWSRRSPRRCS